MPSEKKPRESIIPKIDIHDERGAFPVFMALGLGRKALGATSIAVLVGLGLAMGPSKSALDRNVGITTAPDLEEARVEQETELLALNTDVPLNIADAYFQTQVNVEGIQNKIEAKALIVTVPYSFETNTELKGIGLVDFSIPYEAIKASEGINQSTDFEVDVSQLLVKGGWEAGSPSFSNYTIDGEGKRNYDDPTGGKNSLANVVAALGALVGPSVLENAYLEVGKKSEHEINVLALENMIKDCPPQLTDEIAEALEDALRRNVETMQQGGKFGKVTFVGTPTYTREEVPKVVVDAAKKTEDISVTYNFDKPKAENIVTTCTASKPEAAAGGGS